MVVKMAFLGLFYGINCSSDVLLVAKSVQRSYEIFENISQLCLNRKNDCLFEYFHPTYVCAYFHQDDTIVRSVPGMLTFGFLKINEFEKCQVVLKDFVRNNYYFRIIEL